MSFFQKTLVLRGQSLTTIFIFKIFSLDFEYLTDENLQFFQLNFSQIRPGTSLSKLVHIWQVQCNTGED